ncbi:MAG: N-acetyltransferase [Bacteroidales bacterium]|nr:N-acetyltransferase [Bacteroidales bacterium]
MEYTVNHYPEIGRFEITQDGYTAYVEYTLRNETMDITHTYVPPPIEGRGIASLLVEHACDYAKGKGLRIIPTCSYVKVWLNRHPGYQD